MEPTAYNITLVMCLLVNAFAGVLLILQSFFQHRHPNYKRALICTGLMLWVFAAGFVLHLVFHWRTDDPVLASALTITYFHICGILISWSHIGLVDPFYPSWRIYVRDVAILALAVPCYWLVADASLSWLRHVGYVVGVGHIVWLCATFYRKYYSMRRSLPEVTTDTHIRHLTKFMVISCHLIVAFGIVGSIVAALTPTEEWPMTLLLGAGAVVFAYIALTLLFYQDVLEPASNAIEDIALMKHSPSYAEFMHKVMNKK